MARTTDFVAEARIHARRIWESLHALKALQSEWNALDYGTALPDEGEYAKAEVASVVFDTADAMHAVLAQGHATNLAKLL